MEQIKYTFCLNRRTIAKKKRMNDVESSTISLDIW